MARFYGVLQGQAGAATRLGSPRSGLTVEGRGWDAGVKVHAYANGDRDEFDIYLTGGSNGSTPTRHLGTIREGVARLVGEFAAAGLVQARRGQLLIRDVPGLRRVVAPDPALPRGRVRT